MTLARPASVMAVLASPRTADTVLSSGGRPS
jgi:hypothetical protein